MGKRKRRTKEDNQNNKCKMDELEHLPGFSGFEYDVPPADDAVIQNSTPVVPQPGTDSTMNPGLPAPLPLRQTSHQ